jgi:glycosyltransferase involved in cell wall biosynthesis
MRILHVVHQYPPDHVGGTELYTQGLARRQAAAGHEVAVFCPEASRDPAGEPVVEDGVRVYRAGGGGRGRLAVFLSLMGSGRLSAVFGEVLAAEQPDVVHVQHLMGLPVAIVEKLRAAGIPYVITLHDYWYGCANAQLLTNYDETVCAGPDARFVNCGRCALARAGLPAPAAAGWLPAPLMARRNRLLREVFANAAQVVASTSFVLRAYGGMGFDVGRARVLPLGIDVSAGDLAAARRARESVAPGGPLRVGYVGGLSRQKGLHVLIDAVNRLPEDATCAIYGPADAFPEYVAELRRRAAHPGIHFLGPLSRAALWPALGGLDVLVAPSLWYETYALVVHEAFAAGAPVVASRLGVLPDVVSDGVNGYLFPPGDADALAAVLRRLIDRPELLATLRAGIRPVVTMDDHVAQIEALYRGL